MSISRVPVAILSFLVPFVLVGLAPLSAGGLSFNDKRMLKAFDKDWGRYEPDFASPEAAERPTVERLVGKLDQYLSRISAAGQTEPDVAERLERMKALRSRLDAHFASGGAGEEGAPTPRRNLRTPPTVRPREPVGRVTTAAPAAAPAAGGPSPAELARAFQAAYGEVSNRMRRARGSDLQDPAFVADMAAGLDRLEAQVKEAESSQPAMGRQMRANLDSLRSAWEKNVERAAGQTARAGGQRVPVRATPKPAAARTGGGELGVAAKRKLQLFDKELGRGKGLFDDPRPETYDDMTAHLAKLEKMLEAVPERDRTHEDVAMRRTRVADLRAILATRFPDGRPAVETEGAAPPIAEGDRRFVDAFDRDWKRYAPVFEDLAPEKQLGVRQTLAEMGDHFGRMGYHSQRHPEVVERRTRLDALAEKVDSAYGKVVPLSTEDGERFGRVRAMWNAVTYELGQDVHPMNLQDPATKARAEKNLARLHTALDAVTNANDPKVLQQRAALAEWDRRFATALAQGKRMEENAGDVDGQLAEIQRQFPMKVFDPKLPEPHTVAAVEDWGRKLKGWLAGVDGAKAFFDRAEKLSVKARSSEFQTYRYWFQQNVKGSILSAVKWSERDWASPIHQAVNVPLNDQTLGSPEKVQHYLGKVREGIRGGELLLAFQRSYHGREDPELVAQLATMNGNVSKLLGGEEEMVKKARLPKNRIDDPRLASLAREALALAVERGDIAEWRSLRILTPISHHRELHWWDGRFIPYIWDEFQACVAQRRPEGWRILYVTIKNYSEGYKDVTVGRWAVANWVRSGKILEENIEL